MPAKFFLYDDDSNEHIFIEGVFANWQHEDVVPLVFQNTIVWLLYTAPMMIAWGYIALNWT